MCDILFHEGIVCSLNVSHGVVRTVFQSTLQLISSDGFPVLRMLLFSLSCGGQTLHTSAQNVSCLSLGVVGERCPLLALMFQTASSFPGSWASHCVRLCNPKCVRHRASLFRPLCSNLVPDSRRSSSEPFLARPSGSLFSVCHVRVSSLGERFSASDRAWTFFHSFPRSFLGVMTRFPEVEQRGTLVSPCHAFCVGPPLVTAPFSGTFATSGAVSAFTQIPSLSGLATLGSSCPEFLSQFRQLNPRPCLVCWAGLRAFRLIVTLSSLCGAPHVSLRSCALSSFSSLLGRALLSVSSHAIPLFRAQFFPLARGSSALAVVVCCFQHFSQHLVGALVRDV